MNSSEHIVALCGSQRDGSHTRHALERALAAAESNGATTDLVDLAALDLPVFDPDRTDAGDAPELRRRVRNADGVLLGSPMYHGSYSSVLKTALDYCGFDEFENSTVGLLVVSGGGFPTPALEHLRSVARALDAWVLPHQVAIPDSHSAFEDGQVTDESLVERIDTLGTDLVEYAGVESYPETTAACAVPTAD
ncbi:NADPH-dependent FMN reductase [Natrinema sp. 1APR25-10V2]|uniref:NADPH-dependent FMN reductase n=1 Tax=Natrinema sp. 1APR25-10V2 TaxID=2951081 RepID=UPI002875725B|nr:NADPH-dependent FMN reductase [Natrinema sp. 1APR25-10V2]MDS0477175.1 NAD(P)H-dependent oxidoreductase [Natrinema sp. 1APR25-10V2]